MMPYDYKRRTSSPVQLRVRFSSLLLLALTFAPGIACTHLSSQHSPPNPSPRPSAQSSSRIAPAQAEQARQRARALDVFDKAHFFKTPLDEQGNQLDLLAPLIVYKASPHDDSAAANHLLSAISPAAEGPVAFNPSKPTVYKATTTIKLADHDYNQVFYIWWSSPDPDLPGSASPGSGSIDPDSKRPSAPGHLQPRGIILTLDSEGYPMIWEPFPPRGTWRPLYVSTSLERDVANTVGDPLAGRTSAIEKSWDEAPGTFITRVLADGPMPMGPYVYLQEPNQRITGVTCRCMESQIAAFVTESRYELRPLAELLQWGCDLQAIGLDWPFDPDDPKSPASVRIEQHLRWPKTLVR